MKISTKGTSRFLSQEDITAPFTAIIQDVRVENLKSNRGEENKYILYFTTGKPMVFNVVNRKTMVAAYGDDSANWIGKPIEVYVDPNVWMGSQQTGGIRVRIPAVSTARLVAATALPALASVPALNLARPPTPTLEEQHARLLSGLNAARTQANLDEWAKWGKQFPFSERQKDQAEDRYHVGQDRLAETAETAAIARSTSRAVEAPA